MQIRETQFLLLGSLESGGCQCSYRWTELLMKLFNLYWACDECLSYCYLTKQVIINHNKPSLLFLKFCPGLRRRLCKSNKIFIIVIQQRFYVNKLNWECFLLEIFERYLLSTYCARHFALISLSRSFHIISQSFWEISIPVV